MKGINKLNMLKIRFQFWDDYTNENGMVQECIVDSVEECIRIYGLNEIRYVLLSIEKIK